MVFDLETSIRLLERSPRIFRALLADLPKEWLHSNEGEDTWSPYEIMAHLLFGEITDWIPRMKIILSDEKIKLFDPFDQVAQFEYAREKDLEDVLAEFEQYRAHNITLLKGLRLTQQDLEKTGIHPRLGVVTLQELIATWTVHDLSHLNQVSRLLVKYYGGETGPWHSLFSLLNAK